MKIAINALGALAMSAMAAHAGDLDVAAPEPVVVAPVAAPVAVHDWSGFYAGVNIGRGTGDTDNGLGGYSDLETGSTAGLHVGYLLQRSNLVYGAEVAYAKGNNLNSAYSTDQHVESLLDLKARLGYASNRSLFYGVLGYSRLEYEFDFSPQDNFSSDGKFYGLGYEFAAAERFSFGIEYLVRQTKGGPPGWPVDIDTDVNTTSLRASFHF